jgi:hypothetical protein
MKSGVMVTYIDDIAGGMVCACDQVDRRIR